MLFRFSFSSKRKLHPQELSFYRRSNPAQLSRNTYSACISLAIGRVIAWFMTISSSSADASATFSKDRYTALIDGEKYANASLSPYTISSRSSGIRTSASLHASTIPNACSFAAENIAVGCSYCCRISCIAAYPASQLRSCFSICHCVFT